MSRDQTMIPFRSFSGRPAGSRSGYVDAAHDMTPERASFLPLGLIPLLLSVIVGISAGGGDL